MYVYIYIYIYIYIYTYAIVIRRKHWYALVRLHQDMIKKV